MKYPWVAITLAVLWFGTTFLVIKSKNIDASFALSVAIIGAILISVVGFRRPKIK